MAEVTAGVTSDTLLDGRVRLLQPAAGHRAGTDAVLLAATTPPGCPGPIVDLGASTGAVGIMAGLRAPEARLVLVEIDPAMAELARSNAAANGVGGRTTVVASDVTAAQRERAAVGLAKGDAALVLCNPPWLSPGRSRASPQPQRRMAHMLGPGELDLWVRAASDLLASKGALVLIHRAEALAECLSALSGRFGMVRVLPVHPRADAPASRILVGALKGSRAPLALLPPLVLHAEAGQFSALAAAVHRGEAGLDLQLRGAAQRPPAGSP
jgi:tRNA1(Val) A37 N6-methylase TrmN6